MPRKPGTPKTGGRKAGTPNKVGADVRAVAAELGPKALDTLHEIAKDKTAPAQARVMACREILDRALGKPAQSLEMSGGLTNENTTYGLPPPGVDWLGFPLDEEG